MNISELAQTYYDQFTTKKVTRDGEEKTIVHFVDNRDQALYDSVYSAHGDRLPNDWIFETYRAILGSISDYSIETIDDLHDNRGEIIDGLVDVYTSDLTAWLNDSNYNVSYIDDAIREFGAPEEGTSVLSQAQYMAIDEIFGEVATLLENNIEESDE